MGTIDSNGVYKYAETDAASTFSTLLNLGMNSVSSALAALKATMVSRFEALESVRARVISSAGIGTSGRVTTTSLSIAANSTFVWTPTQNGLATARAELDVGTVAGGYGFVLIEIHVDNVFYGKTQFFDGQPRQMLVLDSIPFPAALGVAKTIVLKVAVYSTTGDVRINSGTWRVFV